MNQSHRLFSFLIVVVCGLLAGCATSTKVQGPFPADFEVSRYNHLLPTVSFQDKDLAESAVTDRIRVEIIREVKKLQNQPFTEFSATNTTPETLSIDVLITRYERGNAAMRAALAGLGQMHIDAAVTVRAGNSEEPVDRYDVKKSFAWGGVIGATTRIEDLELDFAKAVVKPLEKLLPKKK
jgi:hypothetical protein